MGRDCLDTNIVQQNRSFLYLRIICVGTTNLFTISYPFMAWRVVNIQAVLVEVHLKSFNIDNQFVLHLNDCRELKIQSESEPNSFYSIIRRCIVSRKIVSKLSINLPVNDYRKTLKFVCPNFLISPEKSLFAYWRAVIGIMTNQQIIFLGINCRGVTPTCV